MTDLPWHADPASSGLSAVVALVVSGTAASHTAVFRERGALRVTVVLKATFRLVHEGHAQVIAPAPIVRADRTTPEGRLADAGELAPLLPSAGVLLSGHACAPRGRTAAAMSVRLGLSGSEGPLLDKVLHVVGDRVSGSQAPPRPFDRMPLVYERAYGGRGHPDNPVGMGADGTAPPNILYPAYPGIPAGFGPVAPAWASRRRFLQGEPPPAGGLLSERVDPRFFQAAPADQQTRFLRGDEWIVLDGFDPDRPRVASKLPGLRGEARVLRGEPAPLPLVADTLVIDADALVCSLIFRGSFHVGTPDALTQIRVEAALVAPGAEPVWSAPANVAHAPRRPRATGLVDDGMKAAFAALAPSGSHPVDSGAPSPAPAPPIAGPPQGLDRSVAATLAVPGSATSAPPRDALPFAPSGAIAPAPRDPGGGPLPARPDGIQIELDRRSTGTVAVIDDAMKAALDAPLPFVRAETPASRPPGTTIPGDAAAPQDAAPAPAAPPRPPRVPRPGARMASPMNLRKEVAARCAAGEPLQGLDLCGADLSRLALSGAGLGGLDLRGARLQGCDLSGARLGGARLAGADLTGADLSGADLSGADLTSAILVQARLTRADLRGAVLAHAHLAGASCDGAILAGADLTGADLRRATLSGADLSSAVLVRSDLRAAHGPRAVLDGAHLRKARADGADFTSGRFTGADLRDASLRDAHLRGADLSGARREGADLRGASLGAAIPAGAPPGERA